MLWIAAIVCFGTIILELLQFFWSAIPYFLITYFDQGGTVEIGFERHGLNAFIALGILVLLLALILFIDKKTRWNEDPTIYKIAENTCCTYKTGYFVDTISFFYQDGKLIKGETRICNHQNVKVEYDQKELWVKSQMVFKTDSWFTNLMVFAFLCQYEKLTVNMPPERINYV